MDIRIELDGETFDALMVDALNHFRPTRWHATALIRQALGLPVPLPPEPLRSAHREAAPNDLPPAA